MTEVSRYIHLNHVSVPVKEVDETEEHFQQRMERFRKADRRVVTDLYGKVNFGFGQNFLIGNGVIGLRDWEPKKKMVDGNDTGEVNYDPNRPGGWSLA